MNEIEIGLEFVNERCNTSYTNPEDVIVAGEQLAAELLAGMLFDRYCELV